jgi:hypothetical protein
MSTTTKPRPAAKRAPAKPRKPQGATAAQVRAARAAREALEAPKRQAQEGPRPGSTLAGAIAVLQRAGKPMRCSEIHKEIVRRKLCPTLGGKTPVATIQGQLALANKRGEYVCRPEPGVYALRDQAQSA